MKMIFSQIVIITLYTDSKILFAIFRNDFMQNTTFTQSIQNAINSSSIFEQEAIYGYQGAVQKSPVAEQLGCEIADKGSIKVDATQKTTIDNSLCLL